MRLKRYNKAIPNKRKNLFWFATLFSGFSLIISFVIFKQRAIHYKDIFEVILESNNLDVINLNIKFEDIQKIETKRQEAIKSNRLISSDSDFVNSTVSFNGRDYRCKLRLKGDLADHWSGDKLSFRIEIKDGELIKGMSRFSLQDPSTRNETFEYLF